MIIESGYGLHKEIILQRIFRLLAKSGSEHQDQRRLHLIFNGVALLIILVSSPLTLASVGIYIFLGFTLLLVVSLVLVYKNQLWMSSVILPLASFLLITLLVYEGGIHDDAVGGYYFILIMAGLLLGQRALLAFGVMSSVAVVMIGLAETHGLITTRFGPLTEPITIATTAFFILGTTVGINFMVIRLRRAARVAQRNAAAEIKANLELRELQADLEKRVAERTAELDFSNQQLIEQFERINSLQAKLRQEAIRDPLTGLYNRRHLDEMLTIELARSQRGNVPLTILIMDIDHFKNVNDTYGHQVGDIVLQAVGETLKKNVRIGDIACRFGGEEFILVFPGMKEADARIRAEILRTMIGSLAVAAQEHVLSVTISIGGSIYPQDGQSTDQLISLADHALYRAKQNGRNRAEFADSTAP